MDQSIFVPAVDPTHPQPGEVVRLTLWPRVSSGRPGRPIAQHRDIRVLSVDVDSTGRKSVATQSSDGVKGITYADATTGGFPQFSKAADPDQEAEWRMGYHDALEFIEADRRYAKPAAAYSAGHAQGVVDRQALNLTQSKDSFGFGKCAPTEIVPCGLTTGINAPHYQHIRLVDAKRALTIRVGERMRTRRTRGRVIKQSQPIAAVS